MGVLNTVLVPQIVRAVKKDPDRGEAYTNRIMTLGLVALFVITLVLTLAAPAIIALYSAGGWKDPSVAAQYQSMVALAYYCMPQVFFYGAFVLAGQVLNSRDRFGPMMWAPIANNVVSIVVLLLFLVTFGQTDTGAAFTAGQEALLGIGSTVGVAAQAAILVPYLRSSGYHFQPRFDFRHTGLGHTLRLAKWVLGYVLVTQLALIVVNKVATAATISQGGGGGLAAYGYAYAIWILPHSLITVSLATAMLPSASRLAAAGDLTGVADEATRTMRLALSVLVPTSVAFVVLGLPIARLIFGFGAGAEDWQYTGYALMALGIGLVPFTLQYVCLRAFYALENTRTPFLLQVLIAGANVVIGVGVVLALDSAPLVAAGLALGYSLAYVLGVGISFRRLQKMLPALALRPIVALIGRALLAAAPAALAAWLILRVLDADSQLLRALALALAGVIAVLLYAVAAKLLRIREVTDIVATVLRRQAGSRRLGPTAQRTDRRRQSDRDRGGGGHRGGGGAGGPGDGARGERRSDQHADDSRRSRGLRRFHRCRTRLLAYHRGIRRPRSSGRPDRERGSHGHLCRREQDVGTGVRPALRARSDRCARRCPGDTPSRRRGPG